VVGQGTRHRGSRALIRKGFQDIRVRCITASADVDNVGSIRVLEKVGMKRVEQYFHPQVKRETVKYALTRREYSQPSADSV
jgi:RimJ/RimL family protein N-acetyltransferase